MNKQDLKAFRENKNTQIYSLTAGVHNFDSVGATQYPKRKGNPGEVAPQSMTARYSSNQSHYMDNPHYNQSYKGKFSFII